MHIISLLPQSVSLDSEYVEFRETPPCKRPRDCIVQLYTMGYSHFDSGYRYDEVKPWSPAEAAIHRCQKMPLQQLLEREGEWKVAAGFRVDCTALFRYLDHDDIHCGQNAEVLDQIISNEGFVALLKKVKVAWGYFLRDRAKANRFDGLFFDPFG